MNLKIKWKDAWAHLPFWFFYKKIKKKIKKLGETWGMSDTYETENFLGFFIKT